MKTNIKKSKKNPKSSAVYTSSIQRRLVRRTSPAGRTSSPHVGIKGLTLRPSSQSFVNQGRSNTSRKFSRDIVVTPTIESKDNKSVSVSFLDSYSNWLSSSDHKDCNSTSDSDTSAMESMCESDSISSKPRGKLSKSSRDSEGRKSRDQERSPKKSHKKSNCPCSQDSSPCSRTSGSRSSVSNPASAKAKSHRSPTKSPVHKRRHHKQSYTGPIDAK